MKLHEAIKILTDHQIWRTGADTKMTDPKQLTEAIKKILEKLNK